MRLLLVPLPVDPSSQNQSPVMPIACRFFCGINVSYLPRDCHSNIGDTTPVVYLPYPLGFAAIGAKIELSGYPITFDLRKLSWDLSSIYSSIREYCDLNPILAAKNQCRVKTCVKRNVCE